MGCSYGSIRKTLFIKLWNSLSFRRKRDSNFVTYMVLYSTRCFLLSTAQMSPIVPVVQWHLIVLYKIGFSLPAPLRILNCWIWIWLIRGDTDPLSGSDVRGCPWLWFVSQLTIIRGSIYQKWSLERHLCPDRVLLVDKELIAIITQHTKTLWYHYHSLLLLPWMGRLP